MDWTGGSRSRDSKSADNETWHNEPHNEINRTPTMAFATSHSLEITSVTLAEWKAKHSCSRMASMNHLW